MLELTKDAQCIPLSVKPHQHQISKTGMHTYYTLEYLLPHGDKLRVIAHPDKKTTRLLLFTHHPELINYLPGSRASSLVADVINKIHHYRIRSGSYTQPLLSPQKKKLNLANQTISSLTSLLVLERTLSIEDYEQQEELRQNVMAIIDNARNNNRLIADHPLTSEGQLGVILANAYKTAQQYYFNRDYPTSCEDQLDFSQTQLNACILWDSELHLGYDKEALHNTLRILCDYYQLSPIKQLNNLPANRFYKMLYFIQGLWMDGRRWLASFTNKPIKQRLTLAEPAITPLDSHYSIKGITQKGYRNIQELVACILENPPSPLNATTINEAYDLLNACSHNQWVIVANQNKLIIKLNNRLHELSYFLQNDYYFPSPAGQDLYDLNQLCQSHRSWTERFQIKLKEFFLTIPKWFNSIYQNLMHFIVDELQQDFLTHVHADHLSQTEPLNSKPSKLLEDALKKAGFLSEGQTIAAFIKDQLHNSPYLIAQAKHPPSPILYTNPFHRIINVVRHLASFFIETTERNPSIGLLAMAAYVYGAGAVLAPSKLASLLTKLHLKGLIAGIEPTQKLAHFMSHGTTSEAISASATFWQGTIAGGNLDKFFITSIDALKSDPAEIAILACLALSMGYGITKMVPNLQKEIGEFPYTTYAALGGKAGAAAYDVLMHPGEDWLLGTCKWFCKNLLTVAKISLAPFVEAYHYGIINGFIRGWKKSYLLLKSSMKQVLAGSLDLMLTLLTIPLIEGSALLIHVPFRGLTNIVRTFLSYMAALSDAALFLPLGSLFKACNYGLTSTCNWLEMQTTAIKQGLLSVLQIKRLQLYHWAFQQDREPSKLLIEEKKNPDVCSMTAATQFDSANLLNKSLKSTIIVNNKELGDVHYPPLFSSLKRANEGQDDEKLKIRAKF